MGKRKPDLKKQDEHVIPIHDLYERFGSDPERGLTSTKAQEALARDGPNALSSPQGGPEWLKLCRNLFWGYALPMWIVAVVCFVVYSMSTPDPEYPESNAGISNYLYMGLALCFIVVTTGGFGYYQEAHNTKIMESFSNTVPQSASVIRDGRPPAPLSGRECVVGDVVEVKSGDRVPADIRVISAQGCEVDSLTGPPLPVTPEHTHDDPLQTRNMALFPTKCVEGSCRGIIVRTGNRTAIARMTDLSSGMSRGMKIATGIAIGVGVAYFILAFILGYHWLDALITTLVALFVALRCLSCLGLYLKCRNNRRIVESKGRPGV